MKCTDKLGLDFRTKVCYIMPSPKLKWAGSSGSALADGLVAVGETYPQQATTEQIAEGVKRPKVGRRLADFTPLAVCGREKGAET